MDIKCYIDPESQIVNIYGEGNILMVIQDRDPRANLIDLDVGTLEVNERANELFEDVDHAKEWVSSSYPDDTIEYIDEVTGSPGEDE